VNKTPRINRPVQLPVDGRANSNLPVRETVAPKTRLDECHFTGPFDLVEMEGPNGEWVVAQAPRRTSPSTKRAISRFQGPWKNPR
jgi:hypothetical protein